MSSALALVVAGCSAEQPVANGSGGSDNSASTGGELPSDTGSGETTRASDDGGSEVAPEPRSCLEEMVADFGIWADYDTQRSRFGSHCHGTDHQDIEGVERVVFLGDSITVGTPPTLPADVYRSLLANMLAERFGLQFSAFNKWLWQTPNPESGQASTKTSGAFSSCAKWGARNIHLTEPNGDTPAQLEDCFPPEERDLRTLVILTSGGNDLAAIAREASEGADIEVLWERASEMVEAQRAAISWLKEPGRFPDGVFVVFANIYEYTDGTGEVEACDTSVLGRSFAPDPIPFPEQLVEMVKWIEARYLEIAIETQTDMVFLWELFCGHGFQHDNPEAACYLGEYAERWFDVTCIHPNPTGHEVVADMFFDVVSE